MGWDFYSLEDQEKTTFICLSQYKTFAYKRIPFSLCHAHAIFQMCMIAIFSEMVEKGIETFMDTLSIFGASFDECLKNLGMVLTRCKETNLELNWEKCNFMIQEGLILGH